LTYEDIRLQDSIKKHEKKASKNDKRREQILKTMRDSSNALPDGVVVINRMNQVQWANSKAREYVGIRDSEDIGQRIDNLIRDPQFISFLKDHSEDIRVTNTSSNLDQKHAIDLKSPVNETIRLKVSSTSFGKGLRLLSFQDVTNIYRVTKMRQNFIGNASHELRTPLTVIRGYLEEMSDDQDIPTLWQLPIAEIDKQAKRMQDIIEDMLVLSRLESRGRSADKQEVNLHSLVSQIVTDLAQAFKNSHRFTQNIDSNIILLGIENELYSVFSNLMKNAVLYSQIGSEISIEIEKYDQEIRVVIIDQGIGIPKESIQRITERFYRVDDSRSREQGGTGLGLAIVKHALLRHEAHLSIESELEVGSRFICHFPKHRVRGGE